MSKKLTLTHTALEQVLESDEDYWNRKIEAAIEYFSRICITPSYSVFIEYSGRPNEERPAHAQKIKKRLLAVVQELETKATHQTDMQFLNKLQYTNRLIKDRKTPFEIVNIPKIAKHLGMSCRQLETSLNYYPMCKAYVASNLETNQQYWDRKLVYHVQLLKRKKLNISKSQLATLCGATAGHCATYLLPKISSTVARWELEQDI